MHRTRFIFGVSVLFLAAGIVVSAQQGRGNGSKPTTTSPKPNATKPTVAKPATPKVAPAPKATNTTKPHAAPAQPKLKTQPKPATTSASGKSQTTKLAKPDTTASKMTGKSTASKTAKTEKPSATKVAKTDTKPVKSDKPDTKVAKAEKTAAKTGTSSGTTTTTPLTPVQQKVKDNTNLAAKLESRLPKGTDLMAASAGFRNLGQFVAAVNVSNNLGVSFTELKTKMVTDGMSLGQAIQAVRPLTASPTIEAQRAEYDARGMIVDSDQAQAAAAASTAHASTSTSTSGLKTKAKPKNPAQ